MNWIWGMKKSSHGSHTPGFVRIKNCFQILLMFSSEMLANTGAQIGVCLCSNLSLTAENVLAKNILLALSYCLHSSRNICLCLPVWECIVLESWKDIYVHVMGCWSQWFESTRAVLGLTQRYLGMIYSTASAVAVANRRDWNSIDIKSRCTNFRITRPLKWFNRNLH